METTEALAGVRHRLCARVVSARLAVPIFIAGCGNSSSDINRPGDDEVGMSAAGKNGSGNGSLAGTGGTRASGGSAPSAGATAGGTRATGGADAGAGTTFDCYDPTWPTADGEVTLAETKEVAKEYDGRMQRHNGRGRGLGIDCSGPDEQTSTRPLFELADGAKLKNVIFGKFAADGVHCKGSCTLENVWWEDICDDAATFEGRSADTRVVIKGGGARHGSDKTLQHNGGGTVVIQNFYAEDVGKLYRSCGNCNDIERHVEFSDVGARNVHTQLAGVNQDNGDTASFLRICGDARLSSRLCGKYVNNDHTDNTADGKTCIFTSDQFRLF